MITIGDVRKLGDFIEARIVFAGYENVAEFLRKNDIKPPTLYRLLKAKTPDEVNSYRSSLEAIAAALRFSEWAELAKAWEDNDVRANLGIVPVNLPLESWEHAEALAKKAKITTLQQIIKSIGPGVSRVKSDQRQKVEAKR